MGLFDVAFVIFLGELAVMVLFGMLLAYMTAHTRD
jgi:hypothetical protein